jgi:transcriptional regulator with GAF, ATPase, and Fis domain
VEDFHSEVEGIGRFDRTPTAACRVILWDERQGGRQEFSKIIRSAEAQPVVIEKLSDLRAVECCAECCVAVAVTGPIPGGVGMQVIRDLNVKGFKVIACEEGTVSWPIKTKSLPLLAGATQLLDSLSAEFPHDLRQVIERTVRAETRKHSEVREITTLMRGLGMVGESATMTEIFRSVIRFSALSDLPVLITGETGTGKEGLAHAIHCLDPNRSRGPFVAVNCGAISASLAESEFFGHRRGAFTGAERERKGLIRSADGGVLFLDELGDLEGALQSKLLRVLQENRVLGVGEDREAEVSVRVVAASNRDLEQMIKQNKFRADLFHRLNVLSIQVLPLRDRPDDLAPLVQYFLEKHQSLTTIGALTAGTDFLEALRQIELPGNVRQLENLVCQALVRKATDLPLNISDLPVEILLQLSRTEEHPVARKLDVDLLDSQTLVNFVVRVLDANDWNLARSLESCERHALVAAMERMRGNQFQTARLLGITPRSVYNKVRKYQMKS